MTKIAIVDDHQMFIQGISMILHAYPDMEILYTANDGAELLKKMENAPPDIILMDINMPSLNGYETTFILQKKYPNVKIIALTMLNDKASVLKMLEAGVKGYLFKNTDETELIEAIKTVNLNEYYLHPNLQDILATYLHNEKDRAKGYLYYKKNILSSREIEILKYIMNGYTNQEIAEKIILSTHTIDTHRKNMLAKLNLKNTASLIKYAMENKAFLGINE